MATAARAYWWAYLLRANASLHESHCMAANCLYVAWCTAVNSTLVQVYKHWPSPSLLCLWQWRWPLTLEVFFDAVQDFMSNTLFHPLFTGTPPRQSLELIYILVKFCYLLLGGVRADDLNGSRFHPQVSFNWWFPSALVDCTVILTPASGSGMEEHLLI